MPEHDYLRPADITALSRYESDLRGSIEKHFSPDAVDLVVEGARGTGITMAHIAHRLFPRALYVATNLRDSAERQRGSLADESLVRIRYADTHRSPGMEQSVVDANCFDNELVQDAVAKAEARFPALVSFNAIYSLLSRNGDTKFRKSESDAPSFDAMLGPDTPYRAQLHVYAGEAWLEDKDLLLEDRPLAQAFKTMEAEAKQRGWIAERIQGEMVDALLLVKPQA